MLAAVLCSCDERYIHSIVLFSHKDYSYNCSSSGFFLSCIPSFPHSFDFRFALWAVAIFYPVLAYLEELCPSYNCFSALRAVSMIILFFWDVANVDVLYSNLFCNLVCFFQGLKRRRLSIHHLIARKKPGKMQRVSCS